MVARKTNGGGFLNEVRFRTGENVDGVRLYGVVADRILVILGISGTAERGSYV
jgi:hypothetical protein